MIVIILTAAIIILCYILFKFQKGYPVIGIDSIISVNDQDHIVVRIRRSGLQTYISLQEIEVYRKRTMK